MLRGLCLGELKEFAKAAATFRQAVAADPRNAEAHYNLGLCLEREGDVDSALSALRDALRVRPDHRNALVSIAVTLLRRGRWQDAVSELEKATEVLPAEPAFRDMLANVFLDRKQPEEAVKHCKVLEELSPTGTKTLHLKGRLAHAQDRVDEAIGFFREAVAQEPQNFTYRSSLASALASAQQTEEAIALQDQLCAEQPVMAEQHYARGYALWVGRRWDEARAAFERALEIDPDFADAHFMLAVLALSTGDFEIGTRELEWRWRQRTPVPRRQHPQPAWRGEALGDRRLLVWKEQGLGDEVCHAAWLPLLIEKRIAAVLECDPRLVPLFARSFPQVEVVAALDPADPATRAPDIACQTAAGDLIGHLRHWETDWTFSERLLEGDAARRQAFSEKLARQGSGPKIGVSWYSRKPRLGLRKSCPLGQWGPILERNAVFVNLQYGPVEEEFEQTCDRFGAWGYSDPDLDRFNDIEGLVALIDSLDAIVTVSNVTAHIAGALGKPTFLMLGLGSLWYWGRSGAKVVPYPSVRAFRAESLDQWRDIIAATAAALPEALDQRET